MCIPIATCSKRPIKLCLMLFRANCRIPVVNHFFVHLVCAPERPVTVTDDVCVVEVGVRSEEHPASVKFVVHYVLVVYAHHCAL